MDFDKIIIIISIISEFIYWISKILKERIDRKNKWNKKNNIPFENCTIHIKVNND